MNVLNNIRKIDAQDYGFLLRELRKLESLGITMRSWGRLLALVRPDLFFTVSSDQLRNSLSRTLKLPKSSFTTAQGYVELAKAIHQSAWFNEKPKQNGSMSVQEKFVLKNRVAYLDVIFYWMGEE